MLFVPRQVALAAAAAAMAKEEPRKEKKCKSKSKSKSTAAANGSAATDARRVAVVASVAAFLDASCFPLTLAALQSEANLEGDAWRSSPVSLEDLVSRFLDSSSSAPGAVTAVSDEQEKPADAVVEEEDTSKKKKKKKGGAEAHEPKSKASQQSAPEKPSENADDKTKEKKQKKKKDSSSSGNDDGAKENEMVKSDDQKLDGKKKKNKKQENDEDVEARLEKVELAVKDKFEAAGKLKDDSKKSREEEPKSQNDGADKNGLGDDAPLDKGKKKKKSKSTLETSDKIDAGIAPADNAVVSKKRKLEEVEGNTVPAKEDSTANQKVNNGFTEDDTKEHNTASKPSKRQKLSSEPKTVIAFQRVKLDDVKFADDRLQDNSYWAKGGADSGYGAKAQEILGQVRGRGFRHEKTKKKRGTYRGGLIDLQTHSIKFNNSDDE